MYLAVMAMLVIGGLSVSDTEASSLKGEFLDRILMRDYCDDPRRSSEKYLEWVSEGNLSKSSDLEILLAYRNVILIAASEGRPETIIDRAREFVALRTNKSEVNCLDLIALLNLMNQLIDPLTNTIIDQKTARETLANVIDQQENDCYDRKDRSDVFSGVQVIWSGSIHPNEVDAVKIVGDLLVSKDEIHFSFGEDGSLLGVISLHSIVSVSLLPEDELMEIVRDNGAIDYFSGKNAEQAYALITTAKAGAASKM